MSELTVLLKQVEDARSRYLDEAITFTPEQGLYKPDEDTWSASQITEHLVYAEYGGVCGMWIALEKHRKGIPTWDKPNPNEGLKIEEIIDKTWQPKEKVPPVAGPRLGGPLIFWMNTLESCKLSLQKLTEALEGEGLDQIIQPHPISGPMSVRQRDWMMPLATSNCFEVLVNIINGS